MKDKPGKISGHDPDWFAKFKKEQAKQAHKDWKRRISRHFVYNGPEEPVKG